jgi:hypothetical protein
MQIEMQIFTSKGNYKLKKQRKKTNRKQEKKEVAS